MSGATEGETSQVLLDGDRIVWRLRGAPPQTVQASTGDNQIRLVAESDSGGGIVVVVETQTPLALEIDTGFTTYVEQVPAGRTRYLLTYLDRSDVRQL